MTKKFIKASSRELQAPSQWELALGRTESPIERLFLDAFCALAADAGYSIGRRRINNAIQIVPQKALRQYRLDFSIVFPFFGSTLGLAVECDGHEFHEKTKLQAAWDKRRDREIVKAGYRVMRFTGGEIHADMRGCAIDVLSVIEDFQTAHVEAA